MQPPPPTNGNQQAGMRRHYIAQQQTLPQPIIFPPPLNPVLPTTSATNSLPSVPVAPLTVPTPVALSKKKLINRMIAVFLVIGLVGAIYMVWHTATPTTTTTTTNSSTNVSQQNFAASGATASTTDGIRVYVVGAVKNPGIYTLASGARVYDLIQAAGGTLPTANLVAINLAAKLSDGQEVYITQIGETPPTNTGSVSNTGSSTSGIGGGSSTPAVGSGSNSNNQLVNINTASVDELTLNLHVSKKTAQTIIDYRTQNGNFSSVDQLAQVVSRTIYNKIKAQCTV